MTVRLANGKMAKAGALRTAALPLTPNNTSGTASSMSADCTGYTVGAVTNDANDWVCLPPIASVEVGHTIVVGCNAGTNFEMRVPVADTTTKINNVTCGTVSSEKEYLCTDTDIVIVRKATTLNWVAQSLTKLGAVRTAVVPD